MWLVPVSVYEADARLAHVSVDCPDLGVLYAVEKRTNNAVRSCVFGITNPVLRFFADFFSGGKG